MKSQVRVVWDDELDECEIRIRREERGEPTVQRPVLQRIPICTTPPTSRRYGRVGGSSGRLGVRLRGIYRILSWNRTTVRCVRLIWGEFSGKTRVLDAQRDARRVRAETRDIQGLVNQRQRNQVRRSETKRAVRDNQDMNYQDACVTFRTRWRFLPLTLQLFALPALEAEQRRKL